ncbi:GNAT family N-acetyltransferase [Hyphococcus sp.]|uniref:GNAT family N-acetyltransferase n=1 Tax=Hyphococcus sp. TaxID=2038636 RepID=UPI0035C68F5D
MTLGLLVRDVVEDDHDSLHGLLASAFAREDEAALMRKLWSEHAVTIELAAETGGVIVGYCAFTPVSCKPDLDGLLLGLGPLAVAPEHQRQGVGAALVKKGLELCRKHNARLIAVLGDPDYYARFGFEPAAKRKMTWAGFDAGDAFRIIARADDDFGGVAPDDVRTIHYHPAFDMVS